MLPPLLDLLLSDTSWQDNSIELLTNGNFETGGSPPTGWSASLITATTQPGTRTGGSGSYVAQLAFDGVNALGQIYENALGATGRRFHTGGWYRTDGVGLGRYLLGSGTSYDLAASVPWASFDKVASCAGDTNYRLQADNLAAGRWAQYDDVSVQEQFLYTRAQGLLCQTPATSRVVCGDGRTAATFPGQLGVAQGVQMGVSLNGSQYLQYLTPIPSGTYTVCFLVSRATAPGGEFLFDARTGGGAGFLWWNGATLAASSGTIYVDEQATTTLPIGPVAFVAVSGVTISSPTSLLLGTNNAGALWIGNWYGMNLRSGSLTPRQLRDQRQRMLARVHGP